MNPEYVLLPILVSVVSFALVCDVLRSRKIFSSNAIIFVVIVAVLSVSLSWLIWRVL